MKQKVNQMKITLENLFKTHSTLTCFRTDYIFLLAHLNLCKIHENREYEIDKKFFFILLAVSDSAAWLADRTLRLHVPYFRLPIKSGIEK